MFESITSPQNPRVKHLVRLREGVHRRRQRRFLIEGRREIERALEAAWPLETLYFAPEFFGGGVEELLDRGAAAGVEMIQLSRAAFAKASYRENPDGWLAVAHAVERTLETLVLPENPLLLVVEAVEKPGNLGALARTADAAGAQALIVCDPVCDLFNPHAIRASQGSLFRLPLLAGSSAEVIDWLRSKGVAVFPTSPDGPRLIWEADLRGPVALVLGTEAEGLSPVWLHAGSALRLPMAGAADSLNVAAAAAVVLFESIRQRSVTISG